MVGGAQPDCCTANNACVAAGASCSGGVLVPCDDSHDCPGGQVCCATLNNTNSAVTSIACAASCTGSHEKQWCDPNVDDCPSGTSCQTTLFLQGYHYCN
jgi:hypothetical protein